MLLSGLFILDLLVIHPFEDGNGRTGSVGPAVEAVPRCRAFRLPDPSFEPPFEEFRPF